MSFGTTYKDTRAKTIEATVEEIQKHIQIQKLY